MGGSVGTAFRFELILSGISDSVLSVVVMICDFEQRRLDSRFLRPALSFKNCPTMPLTELLIEISLTASQFIISSSSFYEGVASQSAQ
jgi:hypothetical protein